MDNQTGPGWLNEFDDRQKKEIEFAQLYAEHFAHGTDGHNGKMIIAKMANLLNEYEKALQDVSQQLTTNMTALQALAQTPLAKLGASPEPTNDA